MQRQLVPRRRYAVAFVNEQVEEEATVTGIISKLKLVKEDGYGLLMIDNELGERRLVSEAP